MNTLNLSGDLALTPESATAFAKRRLPRTDKRALVDVPPAERAKVQERWTLRQFILDVREGIKVAKRLKRETSRKLKKKVDPA